MDRHLVSLTYLVIYFTPWIFEPPSARDIGAGLLGTVVFLAIYADWLRGRRFPLIHTLASAGVGFALSQSGGAWSVFNVFAASIAGKMQPRRDAVVTLVGLQLALLAFGLLNRQPWLAWMSGLFFGTLTGLNVLWQHELEEKNRKLEQAQNEVRALAATAERERIARDLHDLLGHTLTVVAVKAELAHRLCDRDLEAARREIQELAAVARSALAEVRIAVVGMKGETLAAEIKRAERALAGAGIEPRVRNQSMGGDPQREAVMTMALREAVTNVIRHAQAKVCAIGVESSEDGELRLSVVDDGLGGVVAEGSGLSGMRMRLEAAGGSLEVESRATGLQLLARLPAAPGTRA